MAGFTGRLFGPGLAGTGVTASGRWREGRLELLADGRHFVVDALPAIDARGFNAAQLRVSWQAAGGEFAFFVDAGTARLAFNKTAPPELTAAVYGAERKQATIERSFHVSWLAAALFLALPLLSLPVFIARSDELSAWVVARVSPAHEAKLGELLLAQTRTQMRLIEQGPAVDAVRAIGEKLTPGTRHRYRWFVADRPEVNAFAAPGGIVVVYSGLLQQAERPEELAGVIAHEVAHTELRHGLQLVLQSLGLRAMLSMAFGEWSGGVVADAAASLSERRFSRDAERAADADGLTRLVVARIDPSGMVSIFEKLARQEASGTLPALLATHPATTERVATLRREVAALPGAWQPVPVDWPAAKAALSGAR